MGWLPCLCLTSLCVLGCLFPLLFVLGRSRCSLLLPVLSQLLFYVDDSVCQNMETEVKSLLSGVCLSPNIMHSIRIQRTCIGQEMAIRRSTEKLNTSRGWRISVVVRLISMQYRPRTVLVIQIVCYEEDEDIMPKTKQLPLILTTLCKIWLSLELILAVVIK